MLMLFHTRVAALSQRDSTSRCLNLSFAISSAPSQPQSTEQTAALTYAREENTFPCAVQDSLLLIIQEHEERERWWCHCWSRGMDIRDLELYTSFCVGKETFSVGVSTAKTTS